MSSSRANASAISRRTNGPGPAPVKQVNNAKQDFRQPQRQQSQGQSQTQNFNNYDSNTSELNKPPKLTLQQAIGLTTLRLSRVETMLENLPNFDNLQFESTNETSIPENMRVVDEAIFNNIVSRLEKIEQNNLLTQKQSELNNKKLQTNFLNLTKTVENIRIDFLSLKENFQNLQEFVIQSLKTDDTLESEEDVNFISENTTTIYNENNIKDYFIDKENDNETKEENNESNEIITSDLKQTIENEINTSI